MERQMLPKPIPLEIMRVLSQREKRTVRFAAIGIAIYLLLFAGVRILGFFAHQRSEFLAMVAEVRQLKMDAALERDQSDLVEKLMGDFNLDPAVLSTNTAVANASAAIQNAAMNGGVQLGTIRESSGGSSAKELTTIQIEGSGQASSVVSLLERLPVLGFPLIVDSVQISADPTRPDQVKLNVSVIILNFESWKKGGVTHG